MHFALMPKSFHILLEKRIQPYFEFNCQMPFESLWDQIEVKISIVAKYRL